MGNPKYFIALVPEGLKNNPDLKVLLGKMKRTLKDRERVVRWIPPEMWHITLQFLGELNDQELTRVYSALNSWSPKAAGFELKIQGVGAFPDPQDARVLWLGVQNSQELQGMQSRLRDHLRAHQVDTVEERPFLPHLTLARLRNLQSVADLVKLGGRKSFGEYKIAEVILFQSVLQNSMSKYIPVSRKRISDSEPAQLK
jgi:2'-5' RNA ligase